MSDSLARIHSGRVAIGLFGSGMILIALVSIGWIPDIAAVVFLAFLSLFLAVCFGVAYAWERSDNANALPRGRWYGAAAGIGVLGVLISAVPDGLILPGLHARSAPFLVAMCLSGVAAGALMHWKGGRHVGHSILAGLFGAASTVIASMVMWVAGAGA